MGRMGLLVSRRARARSYGLSFYSASSFQLPQSVLVGGEAIQLSIPIEEDQRTAFVEIFLDDCYRFELLRDIGPITTVLDVGANIGLCSLAARAAFPASRIHAYEPNIAIAHHLQKNAREGGFDVFQNAVGLAAGKVSLDIVAGHSVMTSSRINVAGTVDQVAFRTALDRLGESVDLVKLDCEGAEWEILCDTEAWQRVRFVTMEYHLSAELTRRHMLDNIEAIGFRPREIAPDDGASYGIIFAERR